MTKSPTLYLLFLAVTTIRVPVKIDKQPTVLTFVDGDDAVVVVVVFPLR